MCWSAITTGLGIIGSAKSLTASSPKTTTITTPTILDTGEEAIQSQKDIRKQKKAGFQSTQTSGMGGDTSTATTNKKTLLGQ